MTGQLGGKAVIMR